MKIELEVTEELEDEIISKSIRQHYLWCKRRITDMHYKAAAVDADKAWYAKEIKEDKKLANAFRRIYNYYTGEEL